MSCFEKIWSVDRNFRLQVCNSAYLEYREKVLEVPVALGQNVFEGIGEDLLAKWLPHYHRALEGNSFEVKNRYEKAHQKASEGDLQGKIVIKVVHIKIPKYMHRH